MAAELPEMITIGKGITVVRIRHFHHQTYPF